MSRERYRILYRHSDAYYHADHRSPDQHEGPFMTKAEAWLDARATLAAADGDRGAVLDMTNATPDELREYLR